MNAIAIHGSSQSSSGRRSPARLSIAQYYAISNSGALDDFDRTELLNGEIYPMNAQYMPHMRVKMALIFALRDSLLAIRSPLLVGSEGSIEIGSHSAPMPDVFLYDAPDVAQGAPDGSVKLAIEVADASERFDLGPKKKLYASGKIPEYWVAVLRTGVVERFSEPTNGDYQRRDSFAFGVAVTSVSIAGLAIPADALK